MAKYIYDIGSIPPTFPPLGPSPSFILFPSCPSHTEALERIRHGQMFNSNRTQTTTSKIANNVLFTNEKHTYNSPSLVVMAGDSISKGREFASRHRVLDGHFFAYLFNETGSSTCAFNISF